MAFSIFALRVAGVARLEAGVAFLLAAFFAANPRR
jgi:hypothetical protein